MSYASLSDLKSAIRITDTNDDGLLQVALDAATSAIDEHCGRTFAVGGGVVTRNFEPNGNGTVTIDDIYDKTGLVISVAGTVVPVAVPNVSAGYTLTPENATALNEPFTGLYYQSFPLVAWPLLWAVQRANVAVTTDKWGFAAVVPAAVKMACLLQGSRWFARRNSPYGIAGSPEMGSELRLLAKLDPDVAVMLAGKVRY
jgi:hypothetical protein